MSSSRVTDQTGEWIEDALDGLLGSRDEVRWDCSLVALNEQVVLFMVLVFIAGDNVHYFSKVECLYPKFEEVQEWVKESIVQNSLESLSVLGEFKG